MHNHKTTNTKDTQAATENVRRADRGNMSRCAETSGVNIKTFGKMSVKTLNVTEAGYHTYILQRFRGVFLLSSEGYFFLFYIPDIQNF